MATPNNATGDMSQLPVNTLSSSNEPKRKVSILTDPPHVQSGGYDNPAFDGPLRKISQVCSMKHADDLSILNSNKFL